MSLTPARLHILQHSLGLDKYGQGRQYRNHFCTGPTCDNYADCTALVESGHMTVHPGSPLTGGDYLFSVTLKGIAAVALESPKPPPTPKLTRSKRRYLDFLKADTGQSFEEFLRDQQRREMA